MLKEAMLGQFANANVLKTKGALYLLSGSLFDTTAEPNNCATLQVALSHNPALCRAYLIGKPELRVRTASDMY